MCREWRRNRLRRVRVRGDPHGQQVEFRHFYPGGRRSKEARLQRVRSVAPWGEGVQL